MLFAGFGGQGVLLAGRLVGWAGMVEGRHVTHMPSYGAEMRGGTANCSVVVSDEEIGSPMVPNPDTLVALNLPSFLKFAPLAAKGGFLLYNCSLIEQKPDRRDLDVLALPASEIANSLGNPRVANMVAIGALLARKPVVKLETVIRSLPEVVPSRFSDLLALNEKAIRAGADYARSHR
jgi:2-oxoglutarate ferredoxin oxidoreductase subunit gamma